PPVGASAATPGARKPWAPGALPSRPGRAGGSPYPRQTRRRRYASAVLEILRIASEFPQDLAGCAAHIPEWSVTEPAGPGGSRKGVADVRSAFIRQRLFPGHGRPSLLPTARGRARAR